MTKTEILDKRASTAEERVTLARILDLAERSYRRSQPEHSSFLSPAEQAAAEEVLRMYGGGEHSFSGGFDGAERAVCLFMPDWMDAADAENEAICAVEAVLPRGAEAGHRDVLGSLMGLGLKRETVGDMIPGEGRVQAVILRSALGIVLSQWESIGRYSIEPREIPLADLCVKLPETREITATVQSLRLDSVLACGFSISRSKAAELIAAGRVSVGHRECAKADAQVSEGAVLSCRGLGKCVLSEVSGTSRKGRTVIKMHRYI